MARPKNRERESGRERGKKKKFSFNRGMGGCWHTRKGEGSRGLKLTLELKATIGRAKKRRVSAKGAPRGEKLTLSNAVQRRQKIVKETGVVEEKEGVRGGGSIKMPHWEGKGEARSELFNNASKVSGRLRGREGGSARSTERGCRREEKGREVSA